ncbi:MAG: ribosomal protein S18-alanine N-acetyltransferase [Erysipelotrichaceae bacterium]|nr:ribosomal protein S18-alanine N-acetyltransferase [Erysipelotrichaceae bacterium]MDY5251792.1 ribosomal protein S18-alanine N-acetyltransferase [Erysipelotrichaceae bacterium]
MIRKMTKDDLMTICKLEAKLFTPPWQMKDFLYELTENPYSQYFVYIIDDQVVGYIGLWLIFEQAQITTLGVDEAFQKQGIGSKLLDHAIMQANEALCEIMSLEVRVSNHKAIGLYEKKGFETVNIRKGYYQDNHEDAYLMIKPLGGNL